MSRTSAEGAAALMVLTPIKAGREEDLSGYLEGLRSSNPLARSPRTHFARWVILDQFVKDPTQPRADPLGSRYLIFTSNFDGPVDSYLDDFCRELAAEAANIWGLCIGCPEPAAGSPLKQYLMHNSIPTGLFFAAYPDASVEQVRHSLGVREKMIGFAVNAQAMDPADLHRAFLEEFGN